MLLSSVGFAFMAMLVKLVYARGIPVLEIVAARSVISGAISYWDVKRKGINLWGNQKILLFARGFIGSLALFCVYYAVSNLPFAEATVLQYLNPIITAIFAVIFLKEALHSSVIVCTILSLLGLVILVRPEFIFGDMSSSYPSLAILAALGGALGSALAYVLVRKLSISEDVSVIIFYFPLIALPFSILFLGNDFVMPQGSTWFLLLGVGIGAQVGQIFLTKAMRVESAAKVTGLSYIQVFFAAIIGWLVFSEIPTIWTFIGGALILLGAFINLTWTQKH